MPTRSWWWQRFHPAVVAILATAYFGGAIALFVHAITPGDGDPRSAVAADPSSADQPSTEDVGESPEPEAATGRGLYDARCASCHGQSLEGGLGPALGRGSEAAGENDGWLTSRITDGRGEMPGFVDTLTGEEIQLLVEFLREEQSTE